MSPSPALPSAGMRRIFSCFFCDTPKEKVEFLVTGKRAGICGDCLDDCQAVVAEWRAEKAKAVEVPK